MKTVGKKIILDYNDIESFAKSVATTINNENPNRDILTCTKGGLFTAGFICKYLKWKPNVFSVGEKLRKFPIGKCVFIDDILDSGQTHHIMLEHYKISHPPYFLVDKPGKHRKFHPITHFAPFVADGNKWVVFPWEVD